MGGLRNYSAVATKVRAMESRLLRQTDFEKLAGMESIPQAMEYLSRIPAYEYVFEGASSSGGELAALQRNDMERLLVGTLYYDFLKLYRFCSGSQKEILKLYFRKYEIAEIKHVLRHVVNREESLRGPVAFREVLQKFSDIHFDEMMQAQTIHELAFALRDTDYKDILENTGVLEKGSLFDCEMVLDLFYFTRFWKQKDKFLKKKDCRLLAESFGTRIDLLNMTWIYRAKKYYKVSEAAVYGLLIPVRYRLQGSDIRNMAMAQDMAALEQAIHATYYGRRFKSLESEELERFYIDFLKKIYVDERRREPYSISVITGYLYAREEEIRKLATVLEGIWYGLSKEETMALVV